MASPLPPTFPMSVDAGIDSQAFATYSTTNMNTRQFDYGPSATSWVKTLPSQVDNTVFSVDNQTAAINQPYDATTTSQGNINPDSINALDNPLNNYANYNYHIRFSMASTSTAYSSNPSAKNLNRRIIAETGVSVGFNITRFSFSQALSPGFQHQNMNVFKWKMTITEPFGLTFSDSMQSAAKELGVENHSRFPVFIELWFNGYDEDGNMISQIEGLYKIWRVMITKCSLQTTQSGTVYELEGTSDNDLANTNDMAMTKSYVNLNGLKTLSEAMDRLKETLNKDAEKADNNAYAVTYDIELPPEMQDWKIASPNQNTENIKEYGPNGLNIPIARGQDIGNFIFTLIGKCGDDASKFLNGTTANGTTAIAGVDTHGLARFIQVIPTLTVGKFNPLFRDYERKITYHVVPFYTPRCVRTPEQARRMKELSVQQQKFNFWKNTNMLAKKYEYIYTGKNTEIIKFDIAIENLWQITIPSYLGSRTYSNYTHGPVLAPNSFGLSENKRYIALNQVTNEITARASQILDLVNTITGGSASGASAALNNFNSTLNGFNSTINTIGGSINSVTSAAGSIAGGISAIRTGSIGGIVGGVSSIVGGVSSFATAFRSLSTIMSQPILNFDTGIVDTVSNIANSNAGISAGMNAMPVNISVTDSQARLKDRYIEQITQEKLGIYDVDPQQVAFFPTNNPTQQNAAFGGGDRKSIVTPDIKTGKIPESQSLFGNTAANMYDKTYFLNIKLEIRGDPWWMGMSNLELNAYLKMPGSISGANAKTVTDNGYANYIQGENSFLLTFRTGTNYDEDTGLMIANEGSQYYSGIYCVQYVENKFENGSFTQVLSAYKDPFSQTIDKLLTPKAVSKVGPAGDTAPIAGIVQGTNLPSIVSADIAKQLGAFGTITT